MQENTHDFYLSRESFIKCKKGNIRDFYDMGTKVHRGICRNWEGELMEQFSVLV